MSKHKMSVLSSRGDFEQEWSDEDPASVEAARKELNRLTAEGHALFTHEGEGGVKVKVEEALKSEAVLVVPRITGG